MRNVFTLLLWVSSTIYGFSQSQTKAIDLDKSVVNWRGERIIGAAHHGTLQFKSGEVLIAQNEIVGGSFVVDMNSIDPQDLKDKRKPILIAHLKTDDFFGVEQHPTASLQISKVVKKPNAPSDVYAELTIKGITQPVLFTLHQEDSKAMAVLSFDRTDFNIRYGSSKLFKGLGDAAIKDIITIRVELAY